MTKVLSALLIASSLVVTSAFAATITCPTAKQLQSAKGKAEIVVAGVTFKAKSGKIKAVTSFTTASPGLFTSPYCAYRAGFNSMGQYLIIQASNVKTDTSNPNNSWVGPECVSAYGALTPSQCQMTGTPN